MENTMKFKQLTVGSQFEFDHSELHISWVGAFGPWEKISARRYSPISDLSIVHRVGSVNVKVVNVFIAGVKS